MSLKGGFDEKLQLAKKGDYDCLRSDDSRRVRVIIWTGGERFEDPVSCTMLRGRETFFFITAMNDSIVETNILYELNCLHQVLCFAETKACDHSEVLPTIPEYSKGGGPTSQPTYHRWILECTPQQALIQEHIRVTFLDEHTVKKLDDPVQLDITVEIQEPKHLLGIGQRK